MTAGYIGSVTGYPFQLSTENRYPLEVIRYPFMTIKHTHVHTHTRTRTHAHTHAHAHAHTKLYSYPDVVLRADWKLQ